MSVLRTVECPDCGKQRLLGRPCPCGWSPSRASSGRTRADDGPSARRILAVVGTFVGTACILVIGAFALAATKGDGWGVGLVVGAWLLMHLCRLGYDWEDGIDIRILMLPAPFDWHTKYESWKNLFTSGRSFFGAAYLGTMVAAAVVIAGLLG